MSIIALVCPASFVAPVPTEIFSGTVIPRKKRFYKKDKHGIYFIPEVVKVA